MDFRVPADTPLPPQPFPLRAALPNTGRFVAGRGGSEPPSGPEFLEVASRAWKSLVSIKIAEGHLFDGGVVAKLCRESFVARALSIRNPRPNRNPDLNRNRADVRVSSTKQVWESFSRETPIPCGENGVDKARDKVFDKEKTHANPGRAFFL